MVGGYQGLRRPNKGVRGRVALPVDSGRYPDTVHEHQELVGEDIGIS